MNRTKSNLSLFVLLVLSVLAIPAHSGELVFPSHFFKDMKSWVHLHHVDEISISSIISDELYEVEFRFEKRNGNRFLSSLVLECQSETYSIDPSVLPELPTATTMVFQTINGVAFVLTAGDGEYARYCVYEIELRTMTLLRSSWSRINLEQLGESKKVPLVKATETEENKGKEDEDEDDKGSKLKAAGNEKPTAKPAKP